MAREIWKTIPGFERYKVSSTGRVRSTGRWAAKVNGMPERWLNPKELKLFDSRSTYEGRHYKGVDLTKDVPGGTVRKRMHCHVLVLMAFVGPRPSKKHVGMHKNDVPDDNRVSNLRWGTYSENTKEAYAKGRKRSSGAKGESNASAILTNAKVRKLVRMVKEGQRTKDIAAALGVSASTVSNIKAGKAWSHVTGW
jgi:hypothetical protein